MDAMDYKSKMMSAVLMATTGALFGMCLAFFIGRRGKKRKSPCEQNGVQDTLQAELEECRRLLDELKTRLEHETERRNESEAWNRKLEQDLVELAGARRTSEEACGRLCRDLDQIKRKLRKAEAESLRLSLQIKDANKSDVSICKMPSAVQSLVFSDGYTQEQNILTKESSHSFEKYVLTAAEDISPESVGVTVKSPPISCRTNASSLLEDYDSVPASNGVRKPQIANCRRTPPARTDECVDENDCVDYDDYSDYDEGSESDIALLQRSLSHVSDDNFELGRDVMGALIANAFKDGVIASRDADDVSLSEEVSRDQHAACSSVNGHAETEHGEVSQESIGDTKTTRLFWEQMIAADRYDDDVTDEEDILDEEGDVPDEYNDTTDEEEEDTRRKTAASCRPVEVRPPVTEQLVCTQSAPDADRKQVAPGDNSHQSGDVITNGSQVTVSVSNGVHEEHYL